ncbi:MAG: hypothetical protein K0R80_2895 [Clostridia bacterium]|jgi:hypothetical protein|nr:hypothetical protein [Clostridia bacterium]
MFKQQMKGFLCGIIVTVLLFSMVFAAPVTKTLKVVMNNINMQINGKAVKSDIIVYNDIPYAPIKTVSEALGKQFTWDVKTYAVTIKDKAMAPVPKPAPAPVPKPIDKISSRSNPANINETIFVTTSTYDKTVFESAITILEIIRGNSAWETIYNRNKYNEPAPDGYEYILAKIKVKLNKSSVKDLQFQVSDYDFTLVSSTGVDYERKSVVVPSPELNAKLYEGGESEGWVVFTVKTTDKYPLIAFGRDYSGKGGVWYRAYNPDTPTQNQTTTINPIVDTSNTTILNPSKSQTPLTTYDDLKNFLNNNYATLETVIGKTNFTFEITENTKSFEPSDYWIRVKYDYNFFGGAMSNIKYTDEQKNLLRQQLKGHQESLARAVIAAMPTKKFYGGYYDSWYKYPTLKVDLQTRYYYSWTNYDQPDMSGDINQIYNKAKPSQFRWYSLIDNTL